MQHHRSQWEPESPEVAAPGSAETLQPDWLCILIEWWLEFWLLVYCKHHMLMTEVFNFWVVLYSLSFAHWLWLVWGPFRMKKFISPRKRSRRELHVSRRRTRVERRIISTVPLPSIRPNEFFDECESAEVCFHSLQEKKTVIHLWKIIFEIMWIFRDNHCRISFIRVHFVSYCTVRSLVSC